MAGASRDGKDPAKMARPSGAMRRVVAMLFIGGSGSVDLELGFLLIYYKTATNGCSRGILTHRHRVSRFRVSVGVCLNLALRHA